MEKFVVRRPEEKEVISLRLSTDLLHKVDDKATTAKISRNELITQMIEYALSNMEDDTPK